MLVTLRRAAALAAPLALAACLTANHPTDPQLADSARAFQAQAARFYGALAIESAPQCSYEQNKNSYDDLRVAAAAVQARIAARGAGPALAQAGKALVRLVNDARDSHQAASARTDDAYGPCMASGAIAVNAGALDRAAAAIAASQTPTGDQK
jgi:hypothetical protein